MRAKQVIRIIERNGGYQVRQVGSHIGLRVRYTRPDGAPGQVDTSVAVHPGDIPTGTLHAIQKDLAPALGEKWLL